MNPFVQWLIDNIIALLALAVGLVALFRTFGKREGSKTVVSLPAIFSNGNAHLPPRLSYFEVKENTHAIRGHKLVNHLSLHFRNTGGNLFYENISFLRPNKHLEVEILAEKELEIFHDPRDDQKISTGESVKICFEREIGDELDYDFTIRFSDEHGKNFSQRVHGKKGIVPVVEEPVLL
ncbi:MAG: hypothetical protein R3B47_07320 [Bacteroidia bacterium]